MGVNNDNPCPACDSVYSDYAGNSIFTCIGCGNMFNNETKVWDIKNKPKSDKVKISKYDGGSAFPHPEPENLNTGMTLRDYFAGQAIIGVAQSDESVGKTYDSLANYSYKIADAMLEERAK